MGDTTIRNSEAIAQLQQRFQFTVGCRIIVNIIIVVIVMIGHMRFWMALHGAALFVAMNFLAGSRASRQQLQWVDTASECYISPWSFITLWRGVA